MICFLICCLEQQSFARAAKHPSPDSDGIYMDFGFFKAHLFGLLFILHSANYVAYYILLYITISNILYIYIMLSSSWEVLFELLSAYGTCGLSLGFENQVFSFSGVWSEASQMLLVVTMLLGRLRGLPDAIDASVRMAMPTEERQDTACHFVGF